MELKVTIGATPELTGLAVAVTNLINGDVQSFDSESLVKALTDSIGAKDKPAKEEKPVKETRSRAAKKEVPTVQELPKKEDEEKPAEEVKDEADKKEEPEKKEAKDAPAVTLDEIRKEQRRVSMAGKIDKMKEALSKFGANAASELDEKDYGEYYELLKAIA